MQVILVWLVDALEELLHLCTQKPRVNLFVENVCFSEVIAEAIDAFFIPVRGDAKISRIVQVTYVNRCFMFLEGFCLVGADEVAL